MDFSSYFCLILMRFFSKLELLIALNAFFAKFLFKEKFPKLIINVNSQVKIFFKTNLLFYDILIFFIIKSVNKLKKLNNNYF